MTDNNDETELTPKEQLEAICYQFVKLYERWAEDRQAAAVQGADTAKLVKAFTQQVGVFKDLEPQVRQSIIDSLHQASNDAIKNFRQEIGTEMFNQIEVYVRPLQANVERAQATLRQYESNLIWNNWIMAGAAIIASILIGILVAKLVMPTITVSLSEKDIADQHNGQLIRRAWPKLTQKEKDHLISLSKKQDSPDAINPDENNPDNSGENN